MALDMCLVGLARLHLHLAPGSSWKPRDLGDWMTAPPRRSTTAINRLIARILVAKPTAGATEIRRLLPEVDRLSEEALEQKLDYLRGHARTIAPASTRRSKS
jgi:hypothetical protein